jgi:hypothetical protein
MSRFADFDLAAAEQAFRFDRGAGRISLLAVGGIHGVEVVKIRQVNLDLYDAIARELEFIENVADGSEYRASFGGRVAQHFESGWKICRHQP